MHPNTLALAALMGCMLGAIELRALEQAEEVFTFDAHPEVAHCVHPTHQPVCRQVSLKLAAEDLADATRVQDHRAVHLTLPARPLCFTAHHLSVLQVMHRTNHDAPVVSSPPRPTRNSLFWLDLIPVKSVNQCNACMRFRRHALSCWRVLGNRLSSRRKQKARPEGSGISCESGTHRDNARSPVPMMLFLPVENMRQRRCQFFPSSRLMQIKPFMPALRAAVRQAHAAQLRQRHLPPARKAGERHRFVRIDHVVPLFASVPGLAPGIAATASESIVFVSVVAR